MPRPSQNSSYWIFLESAKAAFASHYEAAAICTSVLKLADRYWLYCPNAFLELRCLGRGGQKHQLWGCWLTTKIFLKTVAPRINAGFLACAETKVGGY